MKAIRVHEFGGPEKLVLEDVPDLRPGPGEVVIKVHAAGVNPADTYTRSGTYAIKPNLPYTPGFDGAGVVQNTGEDLEYRQGDPVRVYMPANALRVLTDTGTAPIDEDAVAPAVV